MLATSQLFVCRQITQCCLHLAFEKFDILLAVTFLQHIQDVHPSLQQHTMPPLPRIDLLCNVHVVITDQPLQNWILDCASILNEIFRIGRQFLKTKPTALAEPCSWWLFESASSCWQVCNITYHGILHTWIPGQLRLPIRSDYFFLPSLRPNITGSNFKTWISSPGPSFGHHRRKSSVRCIE